MFQLFHYDTSNTFYVSHTSPLKKINSRYEKRLQEIKLLVKNASLVIHITSDSWRATKITVRSCMTLR